VRDFGDREVIDKVGFYDEMEVLWGRGSWRRVRFLQDCGTEKWEFAVQTEDYVIQNHVVW
jgi:hypothetical protein